MRNLCYIIILLSVVFCSDVIAQRKTKVPVKKAKEPVVEVVDPRIEQMTLSTQKVIVIDSIVTSEENMLDKLLLSNETGSIMSSEKFFRKKEYDSLYVFTNGLGDKCFFPQKDRKGKLSLYTMDKLGKNWSKASKVEITDIDENIDTINYPFLTSDGTTLFFAAKGKGSIGKYDIFMTTFDFGKGLFRKPENIGMPFNSTANDYMYAIDELNNLGWFVSDRNQPKGMVCIYIFIPQQMRMTYENDNITEEQLKKLSVIHSIKDTWHSMNDIEKAKQRLRNVGKTTTKNTDEKTFDFVVNDIITYHRFRDFASQENAKAYMNVIAMKQQVSDINSALEKAYNYYRTAKPADKSMLKDEILSQEKETEAIEVKIKNEEKRIRAEELRLRKMNN